MSKPLTDFNKAQIAQATDRFLKAWTYHEKGLTNTEIGRLMGVSPSRVAQMLTRAREHFGDGHEG